MTNSSKPNFHNENVALLLLTISSNVNKQLIVNKFMYIYEISMTNSSKYFDLENVALHLLTLSSNVMKQLIVNKQLIANKPLFIYNYKKKVSE